MNFPGISIHLKLTCDLEIENISQDYLKFTYRLAKHCRKLLLDLRSFNFYYLPKRLNKLSLTLNELENFVYETILAHPRANIEWEISGNPFDPHVIIVTRFLRLDQFPDWITFGDPDLIPEVTHGLKLYHDVVFSICQEGTFGFFWENYVELKRLANVLKIYYAVSHELVLESPSEQ